MINKDAIMHYVNNYFSVLILFATAVKITIPQSQIKPTLSINIQVFYLLEKKKPNYID